MSSDNAGCVRRLGHAHEAYAIAEMVAALAATGDGGGLAEASGVVNVSAGFVFAHKSPSKVAGKAVVGSQLPVARKTEVS